MNTSPALRQIMVSLVAVLLLAAGCSTESGDPNGGADGPTTTTVLAEGPGRGMGGASTTSSTTTTTTAPAPTPVEPPTTSVWVHLFDDTVKSPAGVEALLDEVEAAGIEAVFAQVVRRHDAYYRSGYLPATPDPGLAPGFDVLDALIEGAHTRRIQLHAWFVVAPGYHHQYDQVTMPAGHVWLDHGPGTADSWMTVDHGGTPSSDYFDVGLDAVHDHVEAIIADIAGRYEVDGIHLDYVRYDGQALGYHPEALRRFATDTGRSDRPAPSDPAWVAWRQQRTEALMARAHDALDAARPGALLSAAVIAGGPGPSASPGGFAGTRAATHMFQDWPGWLDQNLVDFVVAMAYTREANPEHAGWFRQWVAFAGELSERHPGQVGVGVGAYLNSVEQALDQIELVRATTGFVGVYSYQQDSSGTARGEVLARCCQPAAGSE